MQYEAIRVILGTTKDTSIETMPYLLDLPSRETRHKVKDGVVVAGDYRPLVEEPCRRHVDILGWQEVGGGRGGDIRV